MRADLLLGGLFSPGLFNLYVNHMSTPPHYVELVLYADYLAMRATSHKPTPLTQIYLCMSELRISIMVSKISSMLFPRIRLRFIQPRSVTLSGEPIQWVETVTYLGVTLDKRFTRWPHIEMLGRDPLKGWGCWFPF
jgi:hypothetical protein